MLKSGILIIFALMCLNGAYSQSAGNAAVNFSNTSNFFGNRRQITHRFGICRNLGSVNAIRVKTLEDSEVLLYNGYNCSNLVSRIDVCGTLTEKNLRSTYRIRRLSIMVLPKSNACKYPKRKHNDNCD
ncbi:hypothetical protein AYI69_g8001 [Smittium culicis]|uniref:Uncharacterized protein n=1 Tax=Smittium culicis TaxID=133412 RepID=A0A1R1XMY1_9FUNG|nr:hypothetical protein AYI69_g8001 [Smittium culicis]